MSLGNRPKQLTLLPGTVYITVLIWACVKAITALTTVKNVFINVSWIMFSQKFLCDVLPGVNTSSVVMFFQHCDYNNSESKEL